MDQTLVTHEVELGDLPMTQIHHKEVFRLLDKTTIKVRANWIEPDPETDWRGGWEVDDFRCELRTGLSGMERGYACNLICEALESHMLNADPPCNEHDPKQNPDWGWDIGTDRDVAR